MEAIPEANEQSYSRHDLAPSTSPRDAPEDPSPPPNQEPPSDNQDIADLIDQLVHDGQEDEPEDNMSYGAMREAESDDESEARAGNENQLWKTGYFGSCIRLHVLRAATPGKLTAKPANMEHPEAEDADMRDDSFSELPDEVLEAATPGPSTRTNTNHAGADNPGSQLLPTPDDTNSSTTGSKNAHEDEARNESGEPSTAAINTSDLNIRSSPPRIGVQHADDVDMEQPVQSEGNAVGTPSPHNSSPSPQYPHAKLDSPGLGDLLQPPMSTRRPTLSPIVRVGRSLQHVMSDRSSPEGRESSLGSPFRRSRSDSRQSSVQKSPINERHESFHQSASKSVFNPIASLAQSIRANFSQVPPAPDSFNKSATGALPSRSRRHTIQSAPQTEPFPTLTSSARADPPSEAFPEWTGEDSSPTAQRIRRMSAPRPVGSMNSSNLFGTRGPNTSRVEEVEEDVAKEEEVEDEQLQSDIHGDVQYEDQQPQGDDNGDAHYEDEQYVSESEQDRFEGGGEEEQDAVNDQLQSEANGDEQGQERAEEEEEEDLEQSVERGVSEDGRADEEANRDDNMEEEQGFDENTQSQHDFDESLESQPNFNGGDNGMDLWDIEASRPTPKSTKSTKLLRAEKRARRHSQVDIIARSSQSREASLLHSSTDGAPSRRVKVPSPWKKNTRRLIYQDDFPSPAHIEMDGSTQSESAEEEFSLIAQLTAQDETLRPQEEMRSEPQVMPQKSSREDSEQEIPGLLRRSSQYRWKMKCLRSSQHLCPPPEPAKESEDYSLLAQQKQDAAKAPEKPARKSGFFGAFDIIAAKSQPEEPQSALRATGLFPPIPQKQLFRPSPERQTNLFRSSPERQTEERQADFSSPGTALRSGDTVPDTAEEDDASDREEQDYYLREQESDDYEGDDAGGHEDSVMTIESEYERLPPREEPSRWDKTASPSKSCLRSPLKPKTPGRVVEFAGGNNHNNNSTVSPSEQIETWMMGRQALGTAGMGGNSLDQGQGRPHPQFVDYEDEEEPDDKENSPSPPKEDNYFPPHYAGPNNGQRAMSPAKPMAAPPNIKMPATTIFRAPNSQGQNAANVAKPPITLQTFSRAAFATTNGGGAAATNTGIGRTNDTSGTKDTGNTNGASHWIHLDELLQLRRNDPAKFRQRQTKAQNQSQSASEEVPASAALLGKEVSAQGERILLEPWHLEIVDTFRAEVGRDRCWDEKTLAKRLFALIVGEERRRRGIVMGKGKGKGKQVVRT
ncbi:hypothetical protein PG994_001170 [Apiospora phragmitis]|uniref:Uncharacterized protein n=1 Tax=Apiospora phragmitis TaxID=2905665 RepID=A0ABR1WSS1_9PEZI